MTLQELMEQIVMSTPNDWNVIVGHPSYRNKFALIEEVRESERRKWLEVDSHHSVAAFKPNPSITMAWGLTVHDDFQEPWANKFPDPHASSHHVDVFFNGALVYRAMYVSVDGGRADLPLPLERYGGAVPVRYSAFISLLDRLSGGGQYPSYLERAGLRSTDAEWPFPQGEEGK